MARQKLIHDKVAGYAEQFEGLYAMMCAASRLQLPSLLISLLLGACDFQISPVPGTQFS